MVIVQDATSIPANATVNLLNNLGSIWEYSDRHYWGRLAVTGDAAQGCRLLVQAGQRTHLEESKFSAAARVPILPDDILLPKFPIPKGVRIVLKARNTTGGALVVFWQLYLVPA